MAVPHFPAFRTTGFLPVEMTVLLVIVTLLTTIANDNLPFFLKSFFTL